jgi:methylase of polypeptide subunit release factors
MLDPQMNTHPLLGRPNLTGSNGPNQSTYDIGPAKALVERHRALRYPYACTFGNARLQIDAGVFCPTLTNTSRMLLAAMDVQPGERVLDVFAGSGALAINAALSGAMTVAVDIDPVAATCARKNSALNGVAERVDVRQGTMDSSLLDLECFDLVVANPPLLPGQSQGPLGLALFDPELGATLAFIDGLKQVLAPASRCYFLTSDVMERYGYDTEWLCLENGLEASIVAEADFGYEIYRVYKILHLR